MIYSVSIDMYPKKGQYIEELSYTDENSFEWKIARIKNGFMVRYFGEKYFSESRFCIDLKSGESIQVLNTNCIFFQDADFDDFCNMRNILKTGFTDDIWDSIKDLFQARFECDLGLIESEMI